MSTNKIVDKHGIEVTEGDIIVFTGNLEINYKIVLQNGLLGLYENKEFLRLKDCSRNFVVVNR